MRRATRWDSRVLSYLTLRQAIGCLGIVLPFALAAGNRLFFSGGLQESVSDYFYTGMRGLLVGGMCVIGAFLLAHHGDDRWDRVLTKAAGAGAIGVGLFPTPPDHPTLPQAILGYCHFASGGLMFSSLAVIALWLFRRADPQARRNRLRQLRNSIYLACGVVMVAALALAGVAALPLAAALSHLDLVFWMETAASAAFGVSWLVKGHALLRDRRPLRVPAPPGTGA